METRNKSKRLTPLPGGYRRGSPGADAGCSSMRTIGGGRISRRSPAGTPEEATSSQLSLETIVSESPETPPAEDVSRAASAMRPATTKAGKPRVRMKWDADINTFIMRTYYKITKLETDLTTYRQLLHQEFSRKYPNSNISEQRLSDQRRVIIRNKLLSDEILENIKIEIAKELEVEPQDLQSTQQFITRSQASPTQHTNITTQSTTVTDFNVNTQNSILPSDSILYSDTYHSLTTQNTQVNLTQDLVIDDRTDLLIEQLKEHLETNLTKYNGTDPSVRPFLPRIKTNKKLSYIINLFNRSILPNKLSLLEEIADTHTLIYCSALTIIEHLKIRIPSPPIITNNVKHNKPSWQIRLINDIEKLRRNIARLIQYKAGNRGRKLTKNITEIMKQYKIHSSYENDNSKLNEFIDTLKQKLAVKSHRLSRYKKAQDRKENNKLFTNNEKQFYRKLRCTTNTNISATPSKTELTDFWSNIWSQTVEHNKETNWIDRERLRMDSIPEMEFDRVEVEELILVIKKTHNWKATGADKIHNFWIKRFTSLFITLAEQITDLIRGNAPIPSFLTKGVTYLLPKSARTEDPSQYRPITCLPTLYKIITACITSQIEKCGNLICTLKFNVILVPVQYIA